jgi:hypothetical protein
MERRWSSFLRGHGDGDLGVAIEREPGLISFPIPLVAKRKKQTLIRWKKKNRMSWDCG